MRRHYPAESHDAPCLRIHTFKFLQIANSSILLILCAALTACQQTESEKLEEEAAQTTQPDAKPGLRLSAGKLVLPIVTGRPGAVYFTLDNSGKKAATLVAAYLDGAQRAEMHETSGGSMKARNKVEIIPGETVSFAPGGLHVMAFGLEDTLTAGSEAELTLTFAGGDKLSAPVTITSMAGTSMTVMDHADH